MLHTKAKVKSLLVSFKFLQTQQDSSWGGFHSHNKSQSFRLDKCFDMWFLTFMKNTLKWGKNCVEVWNKFPGEFETKRSLRGGIGLTKDSSVILSWSLFIHWYYWQHQNLPPVWLSLYLRLTLTLSQTLVPSSCYCFPHILPTNVPRE